MRSTSNAGFYHSTVMKKFDYDHQEFALALFMHKLDIETAITASCKWSSESQNADLKNTVSEGSGDDLPF